MDGMDARVSPMPNRDLNVTKRIKTPQGLRYCPVVLSANGLSGRAGGKIGREGCLSSCNSKASRYRHAKRDALSRGNVAVPGTKCEPGQIATPLTLEALRASCDIRSRSLPFCRYMHLTNVELASKLATSIATTCITARGRNGCRKRQPHTTPAVAPR